MSDWLWDFWHNTLYLAWFDTWDAVHDWLTRITRRR